MATGTPTRLGPWPSGMNNRMPDHAMPGNTLRNAVNIDIDNAGKIRRRNGFARVLSASGAHSGFSCGGGTFFVDGTRLMRLNEDNTAETVCNVSGPVSYEYFDGIVYFSDGVTTRKIDASGNVSRWGYDYPPAPVMGSAPGMMPAGTYLAAMTYQTPDGIEHGASNPSSITLNSEGSIVFNYLPLRPDATLNLYLSAANGKTLYRVGSAASSSFLVIAEQTGDGAALDKQQISPPPAGSIIRHHAARMYVAQGKVLWYSEPFALSHYRLGAGFIQFEDDIAVIESTDAGLWIATAKQTFLLAPETAEAPGLNQRASYGAVPGSSTKDELTGNAMWYSTRGLVIGGKQGEFVNVQERMVAADTGAGCAVMVRENNGVRQFVASVRNAQPSPMAASSFIEMEVIRKAGG